MRGRCLTFLPRQDIWSSKRNLHQISGERVFLNTCKLNSYVASSDQSALSHFSLLMIWSCDICSFDIDHTQQLFSQFAFVLIFDSSYLYIKTVLERIFSIWSHEANHVLLLALAVISIWANLYLRGESRTFGTTR